MAAADRPAVKPRPVYLNLIAHPPAAAGDRFDPAPHLRRAAVPRRHSVPALGRPALAGVARRVRAADARRCTSPLGKLVLLGLVVGLPAPFLAGMRHLVLDLHWGMELAPARQLGRGAAGRARRAADARRRGEAVVTRASARRSARTTACATGSSQRVTAIVMVALHGAVPRHRCSGNGGLDYAAWKALFAQRARSSSRRSSSWSRCCGTRGSACATS